MIELLEICAFLISVALYLVLYIRAILKKEVDYVESDKKTNRHEKTN